MRKKLSMQEYVTYMDEIAISRCTFVIKNYFDGNVDDFYNAAAKFKAWFNKSPIEKNAVANSVWSDIRHYNFVGIEQKYIKSIFGKNYFNSTFMASVWTKMTEELGYTIVHHGTLFYKGERHHYPTKYLPPKSKLEAIFSDRQKVDRITSPSSYGNKVKKILETIRNDNLSDDIKKKFQNKPAKATVNRVVNKTFQTPDGLLDEFKLLLDTHKVGTPLSFKSALVPILTPYLFDEAMAYWETKPFEVRQKFASTTWLGELKPKDQIAVWRMRLAFFLGLNERLNGPDAAKMFKDERIRGEFVPANEARIGKARKAVMDAISNCQRSIKYAKEEDMDLQE